MRGMSTPRIADVGERKETRPARLERNAMEKMVVIVREPTLSRPGPRAAVVEAGAGIDKNLLSVFFCVHQLLRACPGGSLPGQVSSGC